MATRRALARGSHATHYPLAVQCQTVARRRGSGRQPPLPLFHKFARSMSIANESRRQRDPDGDDERVPFSALAMSDRLHFKRQSGESGRTERAVRFYGRRSSATSFRMIGSEQRCSRWRRGERELRPRPS